MASRITTIITINAYCGTIFPVFAVDGKYHHTAKKRKLRRLRMAQLRTRFEVCTATLFCKYQLKKGVVFEEM